MKRRYRLRVRNFLGIVRADIEIENLVLVAGINGAGKSSLIEAMASLVLETPLARGMHTKKLAANLLHRGAEAGSISLDYAGGGRRITYPQAELETAGAPLQLGTSLGIGSARLMALRPEDRRAQITQRFKGQPTVRDLRAWFHDKPEAGMDVRRLPDGVEIDPVELLWERIETSDWESVYQACIAHGQKTKGSWQAVTGQNWGSRIAKNWLPQELLPGEEYDLEHEQRQIQQAQDDLEQLLAEQAIAGHDRDQLAATAGFVEVWAEKVATLTTESEELATEAEGLIEQQVQHPAPVDGTNLPSCPHCKGLLRIVASSRGKWSVDVPPDPLSRADYKIAAEAHRKVANRLTEVQRRIAEVAITLAAARVELERSQGAAADLQRLDDTPGAMPQAIERARRVKAELERRVIAIQNLQKARELQANFQRNEYLVAALHPDGVRRQAMILKLGEINGRLGAMCAKGRWSEVALTSDLDATYDGRPYALLSMSERWRVDLTLTALLGQEEGAELILADQLDLLTPQARPGVIYLLRSLGIPALLAMTARELDAVPKLDEAKLGHVVWIEQGSIVDPNNT